MIDQIKREECCGCSACAMVCPKGCIQMQQDIEGFYYPKLNLQDCIECKRCITVCPVNQKNNLISKEKKKIWAYAGNNINLLEQYSSSSGGIFILLANWIIQKGGVVFGAVFNQDFYVRHIGIESKEQVKQMQGSKYVQSNLEDTFLQAKTYLEKGRMVLFSGTPCQIEGLLHFIKKPYENLITVDLLCTGVPSPKVWADYLKYRTEQAQAKEIKSINFRDKSGGWENYRICFSFDNGIEYSNSSREDSYMRGFLSGAFLQKACYNCKFKSEKRNSDLTLGDFWGIKKELPEQYNPYGVSAILIHSEKGEKLIKELNEIQLTEVSVESILRGNKNALRSHAAIVRRDLFFDLYQNKNFALTEAIQKAVGQDIGSGRLRQYFSLFKQWIENLQNKKYLYETLKKKGVYRVGIIGLGDVGRRFVAELKLEDSDIEICYILDENDIEFEEHLKETKAKNCDLIVICSFVNFYELREYLLRAGYNKEMIISLKDLVTGIY